MREEVYLLESYGVTIVESGFGCVKNVLVAPWCPTMVTAAATSRRGHRFKPNHINTLQVQLLFAPSGFFFFQLSLFHLQDQQAQTLIR